MSSPSSPSSSFRPPAIALAVLLAAVAAFLAWSGRQSRRSEPPAARTPAVESGAAAASGAPMSEERPAGRSPAPTASVPVTPVAGAAPAPPNAMAASGSAAPASARPIAGASGQGPGGPPAIPPAAPGASSGALSDRTEGWGADVARQLNQQFMPLASECIDQALERDPGLRGTLSFSMNVAPTEGRKVIVESVTKRADNQIADPELFECVRQSSFAIDGLEAPRSFDITMPIGTGS